MPNPDTIYVAKDMGPQIVTYDDTGELEIYTRVGESTEDNTSGVEVLGSSDASSSDDVEVQIQFFLGGNVTNEMYLKTSSYVDLDGDQQFFTSYSDTTSTTTINGVEVFNEAIQDNISPLNDAEAACSTLTFSMPRSTTSATFYMGIQITTEVTRSLYPECNIMIDGVTYAFITNNQSVSASSDELSRYLIDTNGGVGTDYTIDFSTQLQNVIERSLIYSL